MDRNDRLNVVLFALTGFGNPVLEALLADTRVTVKAVLTVKYENAFPYYPEKQLDVLCEELGVPCHSGVKVRSDEGLALLRGYAPDLIVVSTFKQILSQPVLDVPTLGVVNLHPSLLPEYRGPCPTHAALLADETTTGVTAHYITETVDEGDILLQRSLVIDAADNDGCLRRKLARMAAQMIPEVIGLFDGFTRPAGVAQDHRLASSAPRPGSEDGYLEGSADIDAVRRKVRAFNPLPGTSILVDDRRVAVNRYDLFEDGRENGIYAGEFFIDYVINARAIRLFVKTDC